MKQAIEKLILITLIAIATGAATAQTAESDMKTVRGILAGRWRAADREIYESWWSAGDRFVGKGYRINNGAEVITETLEVRIIDGAVTYMATVPDQNSGSTVNFKMTAVAADRVQFENPEHDFPKKIVYRRTASDTLIAEVSGAGSKGFTLNFKLVTVKPEDVSFVNKSHVRSGTR